MSGLQYRSTRATADTSGVSFLEALRRGLAPDGGLYLPDAVPPLPPEWERTERFSELARTVLGVWLETELPSAELDRIVTGAFPFPVPTVPLGGPWEGVHVLELFHGPTLSFKDFGARFMARTMPLATERATVLVATSGDTGSAVADGFAGQDGMRVVLLYPKGQVSAIQERQLIVRREGVDAFRVDGTFDDCQRMVKQAFADPALKDAALSSANSINIARLLPQMLYFLWAVRGADRPPHICVPSGNLGNMCGAVLAQRSGMPVAGFLAAHNANRFFPDALAASGADDALPVPGRASVRTLSNAMDVGVPSNYERLRAMLGPDGMRMLIEGDSVDDDETLASMRRVFDETGYIADPHTAVGLEAVRRRRASGWKGPVIVAATAHPAKFPETVRRALGSEPHVPERLQAVWQAPVAVQDLPPERSALRRAILSG